MTDIEKSPTGSVAITAEPEPALLSLADQLSTVSAGLDTTDLFPEFLPVDNRSSEALVISHSSGLEDDLTVGSGDGEILDMTGSTSDDLHGLRPLLLSTGSPSLLHHSSTLSPDREGRVVENHTSILTTSATSGTTYHTGNANISQRTTVSVYALHSTTTSPKNHHVHGKFPLNLSTDVFFFKEKPLFQNFVMQQVIYPSTVYSKKGRFNIQYGRCKTNKLNIILV